MLKATLRVDENADLRRFLKLVPYLKRKTIGCQAEHRKFESKRILRNLEKKLMNDIAYLLLV